MTSGILERECFILNHLLYPTMHTWKVQINNTRAEGTLRSAANALVEQLRTSLTLKYFKVDTKLFQQCRQLNALSWAMVPLVHHVSCHPTQQTDFHLSMHRLFLTAMQSQSWLGEGHMLLDFVILLGTKILTELSTNRCISSLFFKGLPTLIWKCEGKVGCQR